MSARTTVPLPSPKGTSILRSNISTLRRLQTRTRKPSFFTTTKNSYTLTIRTVWIFLTAIMVNTRQFEPSLTASLKTTRSLIAGVLLT